MDKLMEFVGDPKEYKYLAWMLLGGFLTNMFSFIGMVLVYTVVRLLIKQYCQPSGKLQTA